MFSFGPRPARRLKPTDKWVYKTFSHFYLLFLVSALCYMHTASKYLMYVRHKTFYSALYEKIMPQNLFSSLLSSLSFSRLSRASCKGTSSPLVCVFWSSRLRMLTVRDFASSAPTTTTDKC